MKIIQLGYGYWGESWIDFINKDPDSELAALCVKTEKTLSKAKEKWDLPDSMCFTDIDEALKVDADVVIIVMPHYAHIEFAKKAVLAGKNVLIEKPPVTILTRPRSSSVGWKGVKKRSLSVTTTVSARSCGR